jgi:hypothetical protein
MPISVFLFSFSYFVFPNVNMKLELLPLMEEDLEAYCNVNAEAFKDRLFKMYVLRPSSISKLLTTVYLGCFPMDTQT